MKPIHYELRHVDTTALTGYFSCFPEPPPSLEESLILARRRPNDDFLRRHLIRLLRAAPGETRKGFQREAATDSFLAALLADEILTGPGPETDAPPVSALKSLIPHGPWVPIRAWCRKDASLHRQWAAIFRDNMRGHRPLPKPDAGPPLPYVREHLLAPSPGVGVSEIRQRIDSLLPPPAPRISLAETIHRAEESLSRLDVMEGGETRHEASLSPIALMRRWRMRTRVVNGRHDFHFSGIQNSYGRGLDLETARASLLMEMVERVSAFVSVGPEGLLGTARPHPLIQARLSELRNRGVPALDPNELILEAPYEDEPLWWIEGETRTADGEAMPIWVPAQCVPLFCNLDERRLFSGLGSTGLASGNTLAGARVSAVLEVIERNAEAVTPFAPGQCFTAECADGPLSRLLAAYRERGIQVRFRDLTPDLGVPCCQCFVRTPGGDIVRGTGAHLDARRALLSALTETPFPFPNGGPSGPAMAGLVHVPVENLPDFSTGSDDGDLLLLERLLAANGHPPIHVDLTRRDLGIPVTRAILPGMDISGDLDHFSRLPPRLFTNYLNLFSPSD